jgi:hypothetical protein
MNHKELPWRSDRVASPATTVAMLAASPRSDLDAALRLAQDVRDRDCVEDRAARELTARRARDGLERWPGDEFRRHASAVPHR